MKKRLLTTFAALALSLSIAHAADVFTPGFLKKEFFAGLTDKSLIEDPANTNQPTSISALPTFECPVNIDNNYVQRVSGFFTPATDGNYVFFLSSDDDSDLFLSTDDTPANKKLIAQEAVGGWSNSRQWISASGSAQSSDKRSDTFSASEWAPTPNVISLKGGTRYYIEADHHEGGGGDNLAVTIKKDTDNDPVDGDAPSTAGGTWGFFAAPATISFTTQPQSQNVVEGKNATLSVAATTTSIYGIASYQWNKNGTPIPGATKPSYTIPVQSLSDTGTKYTVTVTAAGASATDSTAATITVVSDTTPPQLVSAGSLKTFAGGSQVGLIFDEALTGSSTAALSNYTINNGAAITGATYVTNSSGLDGFQQGVILDVTGVTPGNSYTVTVKGVADAKGNAITTAESATFTASSFTWLGMGRNGGVLTDGTFFDGGAKDEAIAVGTNSFNLVNGGNAFWGTEDDITMVYETVNGDFDRQAQVEWNDPSSNWARAGISARDTLNNAGVTTDSSGDNPAGRYQMVISDPVTKYDGAGANDSYETNRRFNAGGGTDSQPNGSAGGVAYPNSYVRLKRVGQLLSTYYSKDGVTWQPLGTSDFANDPLSTDGPLPAQMFVGPTLGVENGNITGQGGSTNQVGAYAARFRNYGAPAQKAAGKQAYSIGLSFGANEAGAPLSGTDVAGVDSVAQANWNNIFGNDTSATPAGPVVGDKAGVSQSTGVTVDIAGSGNTWASHGTSRGENNNLLPGNDGVLMTGYLDTGNATTTQVTISNIPSDLTSAGYDVVVYSLGGVSNRGGSMRVTDANGAVLSDYVAINGPTNPTNFVQVGSVSTATNDGNYIVFKNLKASKIIVEATTDNGLGTGGTPRAPINAIQLVAPSGLIPSGVPVNTNQPTALISITGNTVKVDSNPAGGTVQSTPSLTAPVTWTDVGAAPQNVTPGPGAKFFRIKK